MAVRQQRTAVPTARGEVGEEAKRSGKAESVSAKKAARLRCFPGTPQQPFISTFQPILYHGKMGCFTKLLLKMVV